MIATSVVPPPMSTIMLAVGSTIGRLAPMPAAIGSSTRYTRRAPARSAESSTARFSTAVMPEGTAMTTRGPNGVCLPCTLRMKYASIASVISKSLITPSLSGRIGGDRTGRACRAFPWPPSPRRCRSCRTTLVPFFTATTLGSFSTMPSPRTHTSVLHVPRSIPMSTLNQLRMLSRNTLANPC